MTRFFDRYSQEWITQDFGMARWMAAHEARNRKPEPTFDPLPLPTLGDIHMQARDARYVKIPEITREPEAAPADPYAELKAAHAAGKVIQLLMSASEDIWADYEPNAELSWSFPPYDYRIKPEPDGGECPVPPDVVLNIKMKDGRAMSHKAGFFASVACNWWRGEGINGGIVAYRVAPA